MELNLTLSHGYEPPSDFCLSDFEVLSGTPGIEDEVTLPQTACRLSAADGRLVVDPMGFSKRPADAQVCELVDTVIPGVAVSSVAQGHDEWEGLGAEPRYLFCADRIEPVLRALGVRFARACGGLVAAATVFLAPGVASAQSRSGGRSQRSSAGSESRDTVETAEGARALARTEGSASTLRVPFARWRQSRLPLESLRLAGLHGFASPAASSVALPVSASGAKRATPMLAIPQVVLGQAAQPGYPPAQPAPPPAQPAQPGYPPAQPAPPPAQPAQPGYPPAQPAQPAPPPAQPAQPGYPPAQPAPPPAQPAQPGYPPAQPAQPAPSPAQPGPQPGYPSAQPAQPAPPPAQPGPQPNASGPTYPEDYGKTGIITGSIITGVGLAVTVAGAVIAADTYETRSCYLSYGNRVCEIYSTADWGLAGPLLGVGLATTIVGGIILGINISDRSKAGKPMVALAPTRTGWTGSLTLAL